MKTIAIILAGGSGQRFGADIPKQFVEINGKMIIEYTLDIFQNSPDIDEIVVVTAKDFMDQLEKLKGTYPKIVKVVIGGEDRGKSIINATQALSEEEAFIVIHDACRPFLKQEIIHQGVALLEKKKLAKTVVMPYDDVVTDKKVIGRQHYAILSSPDFIWLSLLRKIVAQNLYDLFCVFAAALKYDPDTDFEYVISDRENIKLTFPEDLSLICHFLNKK